MSAAIVVGSANEIQDAMTYGASKNRAVEILPGLYDIATTLTYVASSSGASAAIRSASKAGRGPTGVILRWTGAAGGVLMNLRGANNVLLYGLAFDPWTYGGLGALFLEELNSEGGPGSSAVCIEHCHIAGGAGTGSYALRIGDNLHQVSEVTVRNCSLSGGSTSRYGIVTTSGNTKNFAVQNCSISSFDYGVTHGEPPSGGGSGFMSIDNPSLANNRLCDVWSQSGTSIAIRGGGSEGSARLFDCAGASSGPHPIEISNVYFASSIVPTDDAVVKFDGQLRISGCHFRNERTPTSEARIVCGAASLATGKNAISSTGNYFLNSLTRPPFYDTSGGSIFAGRDGNYFGKATRVSSEGDIGGTTAAATALRAVSGDPASCSRYAMEEASLAVPGVTYFIRAEGSPPRHGVRMSYEAFTSGAVFKVLRAWTMLKRTQAQHITMDVTTAFAGTGVTTVKLSVGRTTASNEFVVPFFVTTAGAQHVNPMYMDWLLNTDINVRLEVSAGSTTADLTAGVVEIYMTTAAIG